MNKISKPIREALTYVGEEELYDQWEAYHEQEKAEWEKMHSAYKELQAKRLSVEEIEKILDICEEDGGYYLHHNRENRRKAIHTAIYKGEK